MKLMEFNTTLKGHQILVFRTSINETQKAEQVCDDLMKMAGVQYANVDLEDWENVLRLECDVDVSAEQVGKVVALHGFECSEFGDDI